VQAILITTLSNQLFKGSPKRPLKDWLDLELTHSLEPHELESRIEIDGHSGRCCLP
jgi:hypothetical protein